ncbi:MAG TPA: hypothetical protein VHC22_31685 [Pirellulales bacterium]|nr:hypothetical protein [Pirellulales bacterium]
MPSLLFALSLIVTLDETGEKPSIVFDNRPEMGVPAEALAQMRERPPQEAFPAKPRPQMFHDLTEGTIKTVRIRYFNKDTWAADEAARDYVAGFLANESLGVFGFQIWSQGVGVPEIECVIEFTDEHRKQLLEEQKPCLEGRLLIWNTEACFRDATGRWWFVNAFDHFHRSHPRGDRKLAKPVKEKPE